MKISKTLAILSALLALIAISKSASAEDRGRAARVKQALERMEAEPTINEVHRAALRYFRIHPEEVERIRRVSVSRAGAPNLTLTGRYEYVQTDRGVLQYPQGGGVPAETLDDYGSHVAGGSVSLSWNFPGLVFNPAELQTYALIGIQMNVLKEVTRLYYVRRQLLLSLLADPPDDPRTRVAMRLRVEEFTSLIDSFTGGWFSRQLADTED